jgi:cytidylate kinase
MDDLYQGWGGLDAGADYLNRFVIAPLKRREGASWQEWDWSADERSGQWREFRGGTPLIIEGCGALNGVSAEAADIRVWLEVGDDVRHERWLAREGNDEFWGRWAAQEVEFYAREKSAELADIVFG